MIKKIFVIISIVLVFGLTGIYTGLRIWIKSDVDQVCDSAMNQYEGDKIEALISVLKSNTQSLMAKNDAIWALGHLKDKRALPVLKEIQTGTDCDHSRFVCQRELNKAIGYMEGRKINVMRFK